MPATTPARTRGCWPCAGCRSPATRTASTTSAAAPWPGSSACAAATPGPRPCSAPGSPQEWVNRRIFEWLGVVRLVGPGDAPCWRSRLAILLAARIARPFAQLAREADRLGARRPGNAGRHAGHLPVRTRRAGLEPGADARAGRHADRDRAQPARGTRRRARRRRRGHRRRRCRKPHPLRQPPVPGADRAVPRGDPRPGARVDRWSPNRCRPIRCPRSAARARTLHRGRLDAPADRAPACRPAATARCWWCARRMRSRPRRAMRDRILANLSHEFQTPLSAQIASIELLRDHLRSSNDAIAVAAWPMRSTAARCGCRNWSTTCSTACASKAARCACAGNRWTWSAVVRRGGRADAAAAPTSANSACCATLEPGPTLTGDTAAPVVGDGQPARQRQQVRARPAPRSGSSMEWTPTQATVWVEDEGPGLPLSLRGSGDLFAPFRRSPARGTQPARHRPGPGDRAGDRGRARRRRARRRAGARQGRAHRHRVAAGGGSMKILIVDDDVELVGLLRFALAAAGYDVVTAFDGEQALARLRRGRAGTGHPRRQPAVARRLRGAAPAAQRPARCR